MCTIVMPADYEMLVSHSPPVYSHSPPHGGFLTSSYYHHPARNCRVASSTSFPPPFKTASPRRPCLVIRPPEDCSSSSSSSSESDDPTSPIKLKKRVVFADDKGMPLSHVRVMTEPSNVPPIWTTKFLSQVTHGLDAEPLAESEPWEVTFSQPASDYVSFRKRLENDKVSLENVIVKEGEDCIVGTVKVANLTFHKEVLVRWTSDQWNTHEDVFCKYVTSGAGAGAAYSLFDTFSFKLNLPPRVRKVEFCVCFRCEEKEYWDNNDGRNYIILKKVRHPAMRKTCSDSDINRPGIPIKALNNINNRRSATKKCTDACNAKMDTWSEFASWTHLETSHPYCLHQTP